MKCIGNCEICRRCSGEPVREKKNSVTLPIGFIPDYSEKFECGISADIGTTTVAAALWDLKNGRLLYSTSAINPQYKYGADVISRILYDTKHNDSVLHNEIIALINKMIDEMTVNTGIATSNIKKMCVCANTVMSHLFCGESVSGMAESPFTPSFLKKDIFNGNDIGIKTDCLIDILPNIASFVGSDTTSAIIASGMLKKKETSVLIDLGTNGEMVLFCNNKLYAASTAAGTAFEGGGLKHGMKASQGAIESVEFRNNDIYSKVIGGGKAKGICGSGIIDIAAKLLTIGMIDKTGRILEKEESTGISRKILNRIIESSTDTGIMLSDNVSVFQSDIRALQFAKSAIYTGVITLVHEAGITETDINAAYIAGSFGSSVNKKSALKIKLIGDVDAGKISSIGNAAGIGAAMCLMSSKTRSHADDIALNVKHIELSDNNYFKEQYIENLDF